MKSFVVSVCITAVTDMAAVSLLVFFSIMNPRSQTPPMKYHEPPCEFSLKLVLLWRETGEAPINPSCDVASFATPTIPTHPLLIRFGFPIIYDEKDGERQHGQDDSSSAGLVDEDTCPFARVRAAVPELGAPKQLLSKCFLRIGIQNQ